MVLDLVTIDRQRKFTTVRGKFRMRASELTAFNAYFPRFPGPTSVDETQSLTRRLAVARGLRNDRRRGAISGNGGYRQSSRGRWKRHQHISEAKEEASGTDPVRTHPLKPTLRIRRMPPIRCQKSRSRVMSAARHAIHFSAGRPVRRIPTIGRNRPYRIGGRSLAGGSTAKRVSSPRNCCIQSLRAAKDGFRRTASWYDAFAASTLPASRASDASSICGL